MFSLIPYKFCKIKYIKTFSRYFSINALTEHCGWHLKVSLCLERQPLEYSENQINKLFREFNELWSIRTNNNLKIPSLSTIERKITHKLSRSKETVTLPTSHDSTDSKSETPQQDDLESLLTGELDLKVLPRRSRRLSDKDSTEKLSKFVRDDDVHNINRLPKSYLFLILKYKDSSWSLPTTDLYYGDSMRQTLIRLCEEQISSSYRPYFLGYCPFTHDKFPFNSNSESPITDPDNHIEGEKVFYYRARHIPSSNFSEIINDYVEDYAWCTFDELQSKLDHLKYHRVMSSLPLYNVK